MLNNDFQCRNNCTIEFDQAFIKKTGLTFNSIATQSHFKCCPICGELYPATIKIILDYFEILQIQESLAPAVKLLSLSQFESAIREAIIVLENRIQHLANLPNLNGAELISSAFSFNYKEGVVIHPPRIQINKLRNITDINEQEGLKLTLLGFFKGLRNIYMHKSVSTRFYFVFSIFTQISFFLRIIEGASISELCK